ncbi:MAG: LamG domain-containing protein [Candidatus Pacebacteria bacterium]|nr:LamG domain-containing protein [Candidatus Paceibacterota bacterium]
MNKSFTLIEILVVIVIIGILSAFIIVGMSSVSSKATVAKGQAFSSSLKNSLMLNLVSEWNLDDGSGVQTSTADTWGGGNNGTLTNFAFDATDGWKTGADCVKGSCVLFDGTDDYITCGTGSNLRPNEQITVEAWIKPSRDYVSEASAWHAMFVQRTNTYLFGWDGWKDGIGYGIYDEVGAWHSGGFAYPIYTNNWYHVVFSFDGRYLRGYVNGDIKNTIDTGSSHTINNISNAVTIGGTMACFQGTMDTVRIYSAAVPTSQIRQNYYSGLSRLLANGSINGDCSQRLAELKSNLAGNE